MTHGSFDQSFDQSFDVLTEPPPVPTTPSDYPIWCDPQRLVDAFAENDPPLTLDQATAIMTEATWVLDELTDNYYHGEECWADVFETSGCEFNLSHTPVTAIRSVSQMHNCDTESKPIEGWCEVRPGRVSICKDQCGGRVQNPISRCSCPKRIRVEYTIGNNLPPGATAACYSLSTEYANAILGKKCNLPERITSISRQGVSWTVLMPTDFIDKGLVGISRLDSWISIARRSKPNGKMYDPLKYGKRLFSEQIAFESCDTYVPPGAPAGTTLTMAPVTLNLAGIRAGDANERLFTLTRDDQPWNLINSTVNAQARKTTTDPLVALVAEITPVDFENGKFILAWDGEEVRDLLGADATWQGVWDLQVDYVTVLAGAMTCEQDVTR